MPERNINEIIAALDFAIKKTGARYAIVGGVATIVWGRARSTQDIDCIIDLNVEDEKSFVSAINEQKLSADVYDIDVARQDRSHFSILDPESLLRLDCKIASTHAELKEIDDSIIVPIGKATANIASPEDVIAYKLKWGRAQDIEDVDSIFEMRGDLLDINKIHEFAIEIDASNNVNKYLKTRGY